MSETRNVSIVKDIYAAFGRGDVPGIVEQLAPDVTWRCHVDPVVPFGGSYDGKANVPKFFAALGSAVETQAFEPQEFVAQGDTVISIGRFAEYMGISRSKAIELTRQHAEHGEEAAAPAAARPRRRKPQRLPRRLPPVGGE